MGTSTEHLFVVEVANFSSLDEPIAREEARNHLWTTLHRANKWSDSTAMSIVESEDD